MSYVALYRKYRSSSFGEVVGQEHVTTVLQNAIRGGRIAHAYLFCGPRGCGKTSTARLLARALNCLGADGAATGPTAEPCGTCSLCARIREGAAMDVIEMDAASETGIDDVREKIIENAKYAPGEARFKVYIIDEVHDLSLKAFDSLLKTIEEPPAHVVFILATTEAHKVPITVRSRCQRMDFRRGTLNDLVANIERVLASEGIAYETEAVLAVARAAEGSFRDSLSLLEQALAYTDGDRLTQEAVHASIGTVGTRALDEIVEALASDDMYAVFLKAGEVVESGKDVKQALVALQAHLRDLLVAGIARGPEALAEVSPERFAQIREQADRFSPPQLLRMLDVLADAERDLRFTNQHQRLLETALWKALPRNLSAAAADAVATPAARPQPSRPVPAPQPRPAARPEAHQPEAQSVPAAAVSPAPAPNAAAPVAEPSPATTGNGSDGHFADEVDLEVIQRAWPRVRQKIVQRSKAALAYFGKEAVLALEGRFVVVGFPDDFTLSHVDRPKGRDLVEQVLAAELGVKGLKVRCVLAESPASQGPAVAAPEPVALGLPVEEHAPHEPNGSGAAVVSAAPDPPTPVAPDPDSAFLQDVIETFGGTLLDG